MVSTCLCVSAELATFVFPSANLVRYHTHIVSGCLLSQVYKHVAKTNGDNCLLTSEDISFETEELLVGDKVCHLI